MKHAKQFREVIITGAQCTSDEALHGFLKRELELPDYYGMNLSALADCLAEEDRPTLITFKIDEDEIEAGMEAYLLRLVQVVARESFVNPNVALIIEH